MLVPLVWPGGTHIGMLSILASPMLTHACPPPDTSSHANTCKHATHMSTQISDIQYDDDAYEPMKSILESVIQELHVIVKSGMSRSCPTSPRPMEHASTSFINGRPQSARP